MFRGYLKNYIIDLILIQVELNWTDLTYLLVVGWVMIQVEPNWIGFILPNLWLE